jgi:hypothetical protein
VVLLGGKIKRTPKEFDVAGRARLQNLLDQFEESCLERTSGTFCLRANEGHQPYGFFQRGHQVPILVRFDAGGERRVQILHVVEDWQAQMIEIDKVAGTIKEAPIATGASLLLNSQDPPIVKT